MRKLFLLALVLAVAIPLLVDELAARRHPNRANSLGAAEGDRLSEFPSVAGSGRGVTLCHIPPGNLENAQTIVVGEAAVAAHLAHGDSLGACAEACDDEDSEESADAAADCLVTRVTTDLDAAIPTATLSGTFCESPSVAAGQDDGSLQELLVLASGANFITVDLTGNDDPMGVLIRITCPCDVCESEITIGAAGPPGPQGPAGPTDPDLEEIKAKLCELCLESGVLPLPSFCEFECFDPSAFFGTQDDDAFAAECLATGRCPLDQYCFPSGLPNCRECVDGVVNSCYYCADDLTELDCDTICAPTNPGRPGGG
jgi:hypothetical protein